MNKKQSNLSLGLLIFIAVFGINNIPSNYAAIGGQSLIWFGLLTIYFIPLALIMAELASYNPEDASGISGWVRNGTNKHVAFMCGWSYFIANIFYIPMLASRVPVMISWMFTPIKDLTTVTQNNGDIPGILTSQSNPMLFLILAFVTVIITVLCSFYFEKIFERMGGVLGVISLIIAFAFIIFTFIAMMFFLKEPAYPLTMEHLKPQVTIPIISTLAWILFAIGGTETIGTVVNKVENPNKQLPKIVTIGAVLVIIAYVIGILGMTFVATPESFSLDYLDNSFQIMYADVLIALNLNGIVGVLILKIIILLQIISTIAALVIWFMATVNVLFTETEEGIFPKAIMYKSSNGVPIGGMVLSTVLITMFLLLSAFANNVYFLLYDMSTIAMILPFILLLTAYVNFKKNDKKGGYVFIKNKTLSLTVGITMALITILALFFGTFDIEALVRGDFHAFGQSVLVYFGGLTFFLSIGVVLYLLGIKKNKSKN